MDTPIAPTTALRDYLLEQSRACIRPPVDRFEHPWLAPMPLSPAAKHYLESRAHARAAVWEGDTMSIPNSGDGFAFGDYSLGLFHHDASEAAIALSAYEEFRPAVFGSLLCFLDCARADGLVHRIELPYKAREAEPAKPVIAHFALTAIRSLGDEGLALAERHRVLPRVMRFLDVLERDAIGLHGLFLTRSSRNSGFDNDILTAGLPENTVEGPDTNAFMVREYRAAAELAELLGSHDRASEYHDKAERLVALMNRLMWYEDERGGMYVALQWQHGVGSLESERVGFRDPDGLFRPAESWACLLPLYVGIPSPARAERMIARLGDPNGYWGPWGIRTAPAYDPFFSQAARVLVHDPRKDRRGPVSNWMGPVWVLSNYYLAQGLARYGANDLAGDLARKTVGLLSSDLERTGTLHECYDDAGLGLWPRRGTFVSWNVLALLLF